MLKRFMTPIGNMNPRFVMKTCRKHQKKVKRAIKRATAMGIFSWKKGVFVIRNPFDTIAPPDDDLQLSITADLTREELKELREDRSNMRFVPFYHYSSTFQETDSQVFEDTLSVIDRYRSDRDHGQDDELDQIEEYIEDADEIEEEDGDDGALTEEIESPLTDI